VGMVALVAAAPAGKFLRAAPLRVQVVGDIPGILGSMKVFESKGLTPGALEAMEDAIELLVTSGDDAGTKAAVKQMNLFIGKARARRVRAQSFDQKQIDSHVESIKSCSLEKAKLSNASLGANMTYAKKLKVDHKEHAGAHADCVFVEEAKDLLKDSVCGGVKNVDKECRCHSKITEKVGVRPECMNITKHPANGKKCCDAYANLVVHRAECTDKKANMDFAHRQRTLLLRKLCTNYGKCYSEKVKAYVAVEKKVQFNENNRQWVALYRIQCLMDSFEKGKVTKTTAKTCKEQKYKVPAISYPKTPAKDECAVPSFLQEEPEDGSDELQADSDAALFGGSDEDESDSALYGSLLQQEPEDGSDELQAGSDAALFGGSDEDESDSALYGSLLQQEPEDGSDELQADSDAALFGGSDEGESDSALYGAQSLIQEQSKQEPEEGSDLALYGTQSGVQVDGQEDSDVALYGGATIANTQSDSQEAEDTSSEKDSDSALYGSAGQDESDRALYGSLIQQEPEDGSDELMAGSDAALYGASTEGESDSALYGAQ